MKLSTLRSRMAVGQLRLARRTVNPGTSSVYDVIDFIAPYGRTLMSIGADDLFDADGNRFEDDL